VTQLNNLPTKLQIIAKNLNFYYGNKQVLKNVSFVVEKGDYIGLIGPNGGGKTTLIKLILGLIPSFSDCSCISLLLDRSKVGYVPQRASQNLFNFPATVLEIIASGGGDKQKVEQVIQAAKIAKLKDKLISNLSGGELQKVLIARALVSDPEILILDEPIVGVDAPSQKEFYEFLSRLNKENQITVVFVSHDLDVITKEANKVFCLNQSLDAHLDSSKFLDAEYIEKIFGKNKELIHHHHH
jgi:zinc transport system ATP-binding protein